MISRKIIIEWSTGQKSNYLFNDLEQVYYPATHKDAPDDKYTTKYSVEDLHQMLSLRQILNIETFDDQCYSDYYNIDELISLLSDPLNPKIIVSKSESHICLDERCFRFVDDELNKKYDIYDNPVQSTIEVDCIGTPFLPELIPDLLKLLN